MSASERVARIIDTRHSIAIDTIDGDEEDESDDDDFLMTSAKYLPNSVKQARSFGFMAFFVVEACLAPVAVKSVAMTSLIIVMSSRWKLPSTRDWLLASAINVFSISPIVNDPPPVADDDDDDDPAAAPLVASSSSSLVVDEAVAVGAAVDGLDGDAV